MLLFFSDCSLIKTGWFITHLKTIYKYYVQHSYKIKHMFNWREHHSLMFSLFPNLFYSLLLLFWGSKEGCTFLDKIALSGFTLIGFYQLYRNFPQILTCSLREHLIMDFSIREFVLHDMRFPLLLGLETQDIMR